MNWLASSPPVTPTGVATLIGGALDTAFGWQSIFVFMAVFATLVLACVSFLLPETRAVTRILSALSPCHTRAFSPSSTQPLPSLRALVATSARSKRE